MADDYQELDVFGRPKSKVGGVPYVNADDEDVVLKNYVAGLPVRELAVEPTTGFEYYRTVVPGRDTPVQGVHDYVPGQAAADWARANPVKFFPGLDRTPIELDTWDNIKNKIFGPRQGQTVNTLGRSVRMPARATFDERFGIEPTERAQMWPEKMVRSGASLPGDVYEGRVRADFSRPGDFSDDPNAANPLAPLIERTQDLAGLAAGGSVTGVAAEGTARAPKPVVRRVKDIHNAPADVIGGEAEVRPARNGKGWEIWNSDTNELWITQAGKGMSKADAQWQADMINKSKSDRAVRLNSDDELGTAISGLQGRKDLTEGSFGGNVPPSIARNIGRETMPEILARQRASEGYEAAIRDSETKKITTGAWHEEVIDKIAKERGIPRDEVNLLVSSPAKGNLVKGYVDYNGKFWTEQQVENKSRSRTAMFRADDEVGAAVAAMNASEGKAPYKPARMARENENYEEYSNIRPTSLPLSRYSEQFLQKINDRHMWSSSIENVPINKIRTPREDVYTNELRPETWDSNPFGTRFPYGIRTPDGEIHLLDGSNRSNAALEAGKDTVRMKVVNVTKPQYDALRKEYETGGRSVIVRSDDEAGAVVSALKNSGRAPQLKPAEAAPVGNLPAVITPQGAAVPGSAINPISNRRRFLRGARDLMAAASNANKIVSMAEKLGQPVEMPIPKHPKVPLKEIWKSGEGKIPDYVYDQANDWAHEEFWDKHSDNFKKEYPQFKKGDMFDENRPGLTEALEKYQEKHQKDFDALEEQYVNTADWELEGGEGGTQFSHNQLPGATNYREHLMQMPEPEAPKALSDAYDAAKNEHSRLGELSNWNGHDVATARAGKKVEELGTQIEEWRRKQQYKPYYGGSFDEPDIIGHTLVNDRTLKGGEKSLHVEEAGSELHEKGKKHGYGARDQNKLKDVHNKIKDRVQILKKEYEDGARDTLSSKDLDNDPVLESLHKQRQKLENSVPNLPFKSTHMDLSVNRMLHEAATQGYDALSWTPHDVQKKLYGNDSNKDFHARIEAIAKKYGGKIEKEQLPAPKVDEDIAPNGKTRYSAAGVKSETITSYDRAEVEKWVAEQNKPSPYIYHLKLTPDMKRIFGHDDFSFFPKEQPKPLSLQDLDDAVAKRRMEIMKETGLKGKQGLATDQLEAAWNNDPKIRELTRQTDELLKARSSPGFKLRSDSEAGAAVGALRNSGPAPTFYSGLARTLERAPFEEATSTQWAKYLRDTVGARQAEEFEHVGLADKIGKLEEEKKAVERPAQGALDAWKTANPRQRPPKELMDAASTENKRIVEQKLKDRDTDKPLTKQELMRHVEGNQPKFKEIVKKGEVDEESEDILRNEAHYQAYNERPRQHGESEAAWNDAVANLADDIYDDLAAKRGNTAKYSDYQLPGGTNYREHLMTMPPDWHYPGRKDAPSQAARENTHYSSHWDEPNVVVHTRMNDRELLPTWESNSKTPLKSLHAEEFQSDLHQEGRKKGYKTKPEYILEGNGPWAIRTKDGRFIRDFNNKEGAEGVLKELKAGDPYGVDQGFRQSVPDFPFKKSWPDLAIKRWLREAVDNDYDAVSWTPGEAQRDRFQLGHTIEKLYYDKLPNGDYLIGGEHKNGAEQPVNRGLPVKDKDLAQHVGEAIAEKIRKDEGKKDAAGIRTLDNQDLKVGGEGLVSFYDKTVKAKIQALVEKHGGKVEKHEITTRTPSTDWVNGNKVMDDMGLPSEQQSHYWRGLSQQKRDELIQKYRVKHGEDKKDYVWSVKLTPELKRAIRSEGFPLFSSGLPLVPVDHDPFDKKQKPKPRLEPVEHDPFAIPTPDMGGALNKLVSEGYRPKPRPIQNGFGVRNEGAR